METTPLSKSDPGRPVLRHGGPSDLDAINRLENEAFESDRIARRSFARLLRSPSATVLVAESCAAVEGCAVLLFRSYSRRCRLYSLAVARSARGKGIGSALLEAVEREASGRGCEAVGLEVREENHPAIALYRRSGYELLGQTENYYSDGATALHFRKALREAGRR
ncbi:MAG: GNAT family N-acetyltransferase [Methylobacterium mesophilicum]|nr:GNAT family N-acetyltransferase [Methylobacterium mesophilicum]